MVMMCSATGVNVCQLYSVCAMAGIEFAALICLWNMLPIETVKLELK